MEQWVNSVSLGTVCRHTASAANSPKISQLKVETGDYVFLLAHAQSVGRCQRKAGSGSIAICSFERSVFKDERWRKRILRVSLYHMHVIVDTQPCTPGFYAAHPYIGLIGKTQPTCVNVSHVFMLWPHELVDIVGTERISAS